ncbi:MAG: DUF4282 domain-containing protein [Phycisphaeraceae bacterium]
METNDHRFAHAGFEGLLDFGFSRFITLNVIKVLYILGMVVIALAWFTAVVGGFAQGGAGIGFGMLIFASVAAVLYLIFYRVWLELIVVIFRIGEHTARLAGPADSASPPPSP